MLLPRSGIEGQEGLACDGVECGDKEQHGSARDDHTVLDVYFETLPLFSLYYRKSRRSIDMQAGTSII